jgi:hypothetical protein
LLRLISLAFRKRFAKNTGLMALAWIPLAAFASDLGQRGPIEFHDVLADEAFALLKDPPVPLATGDADRDGLADDLEQSLAERYSPIVILDRRDWNRPASIPWILSRVDFRDEPGVAYAGIVPGVSTPGKQASFSRDARSGSPDPNDWTVYTHVFPRVDGGVSLQYWFYYPYNDGPAFFDHESDWEHMTVRLDADHRPVGVYLARHEDNDPGPFRSWSAIRKSGAHPVVLSARGDHATYADAQDLTWFESAGQCTDLDRCDDPVWRTWQGGGIVNVGERSAPQILPALMSYAGRWGASRLFPGTSAPVGPTFAAGFCNAAFRSCDVGYRAPSLEQAQAQR